jgi:hypothetical protein
MESSLRGNETMKVGSNIRTARKMSRSVIYSNRVQTLRERVLNSDEKGNDEAHNVSTEETENKRR